MKRFFLISCLITSISSFSQDEARFGFILGVNEYYNNANFLSSKSGVGFTVGAVNSAPISEYSEILVEITFSRFKTEFLGRKDLLADPEWIKFHLDRMNVSAIYDYDILHFYKEDLAIGLNAGPSVSVFNNFSISDQSKEDYLLDPYAAESKYLEMDSYSDTITFNVFAALGVSVRYRNLEGSFRYYKGLSNTYSKLALSSDYMTLKGKDNYASFTLTYYLGDYF